MENSIVVVGGLVLMAVGALLVLRHLARAQGPEGYVVDTHLVHGLKRMEVLIASRDAPPRVFAQLDDGTWHRLTARYAYPVRGQKP